MEAKCYNASDFTNLITAVHGKKRPQTEEEKWKRQEEYLQILNDAPKQWGKLVDEHRNIFQRLGYLELIVYSDLSVERKKLQRGRPKEVKSKEYMLNVRLDDELQTILSNYCNTKNKTESDVIRELIRKLY
jgi:hypothetical protein